MAKNDGKRGSDAIVVTAAEINPLAESGVGKLIQVIRDKQVLLDRDLARLYGVETKRINEQVKRNIERFPQEFCFQLDKPEFEKWKSQIAISNSEKMGLRKIPFAFTEQGVAMLSAVLHSPTAVRVSIDIMKAFVEMRHYLMQNGGLVRRLSNVEAEVLDQRAKLADHDRFLFIDDIAYHFGASLKDLGKNTFFFTKEEFSLEEVLKRSEEKSRALQAGG